MISFDHNIRAFERSLSDLARRQLPFATALALNDTAAEVREAWQVQMKRRLDRPTPFTLRGVFMRRASKRRLTATVGVKDVQAGYLKYQVRGGTRLPVGRAIPVPVGQRRNKYGNMPKGALKRVIAKPDVFVGKVGAVPGVWKRPRRTKAKKIKSPTLLVAFEPRVTYQPRLDLERAAKGRARAAFPRHFSKRLKQAIATAR